MESVTWVTEGSLWEHEWMRHSSFIFKVNEISEALDNVIHVLCPLQWRLFSFSAPSDLNHQFARNGTKIEKFRKVVNRTFF